MRWPRPQACWGRPTALALIERLPGVEALFVWQEGEEVVTRGTRRFLGLDQPRETGPQPTATTRPRPSNQ